MTRGIFIYLLAALFLFYEMALQVSPGVMTIFLMRDFKIDAYVLGIMASFYFYSYTLMQIPAGVLFDRFSPKILIPAATLVCALGSLFFGGTSSVFWGAIGRLFMGVGSAFAFIGVLVVASRFFKPSLFALFAGLAQFLAGLGAMGGAYPLARWVDVSSWQHVMISLAWVGIALAIVGAFVIKDKPHDEEIHGVCKTLKTLFKRGQTWWIAAYAFTGWTPVAVFGALWGVPYFMSRYQVSNTKAASAIACLWLGIALAAPFVGYLSDWIGRRKTPIQVCALLGGFSSLAILYLHPPFTLACALCFIFGIGSAGQILSFALVRDINRKSNVATAIGFNNMALVAGGAIVQPLVGYFLSLTWDGKIEQGVPIYAPAMFEIALAVVPAIFFLGFLISTFAIRETYCKHC
ncbi:MAG: hypothetical protein SP1CHLAM54_07890 [Chlamydiia bacterium]|nr:hypothetical protein [Chlamydiia bacterium]MCH9615695.1 hypothetical protein [Chlamydiia bacterium]MCH9628902.1 hypothetical protein [Chlamydiia bacterium]